MKFYCIGQGSSGVTFGKFKDIGPLDANLKPRNFTWLRKTDMLFVVTQKIVHFNYFHNGFHHSINAFGVMI